MKASKTLASAFAAAAVVGAIGMAYAQTPDPATQSTTATGTSALPPQNQVTNSDASTPATSSGSTMSNSTGTTTDTTGFQTERPAQADRN
jgi:hypothetical protein